MSEVTDELYRSACTISTQMGYAATSLFQRRLRIGYALAAEIVDLMEERGFCEMFNPNRRDSGKRRLLKEPSHD